MKRAHYLFFGLLLLLFFSCNKETSFLPEIKDEAGLIVDTSNTNGTILGIPLTGVETEQATVTFTEAQLNYEIDLSSGTTNDIENIEIVKTFSGDINNTEITVIETSELPFSYSLNTIDEFLEGFSISESELRIGDSFTFKLKVHQKDGDTYYYDSSNNTTITITDPSTNDILNITAAWDNTYTYTENGNTTILEASNQVDFDVYLYDTNYNYVATIAESPDYPEVGIISGLDDGNYMIGVYLYDNFLSSYNINETISITITYSQEGFIEETSFINNEFNTNDAWDDYKEVIVAEIEVVNGYLYTVTPL